MSYAIHPLAALIPEMTADQYAELRDDIAAHGLYEPIVLHEHTVLDGRHRLRACEEAGVEPQFKDFDGPSPVEFVISKNVKRRHLSPSQLAAIAVAFLPAMQVEARANSQQGVRTDLATSLSVDREVAPRRAGQPALADEQAASLVGVSASSVTRAKRVHDQEPEMFEQVKAGAITVFAADTAIRESKTEPAAPRTRNPINQRRMPPAGLVVPRVLAGLRLYAQELDRALNTGTVKAAEAADWSRDIREIRTELTRSINALKEHL